MGCSRKGTAVGVLKTAVKGWHKGENRFLVVHACKGVVEKNVAASTVKVAPGRGKRSSGEKGDYLATSDTASQLNT